MDKESKSSSVRTPPLTGMLRQMSMRFDNAELQGMNAAQRAAAITSLASLLIQAAASAIGKERDDDER